MKLNMHRLAILNRVQNFMVDTVIVMNAEESKVRMIYVENLHDINRSIL